MSKISLTNLANLQNETTAVNAINNNNAILVAAMDNTISRNGLSPNTWTATQDANSNRLLNLPDAVLAQEPATLSQLNAVSTLSGNVPLGGTTGQILTKTSNANFALGWSSAINGLNISASTGTLTIANGKTFTGNNTLTLAGTDGTSITFQGTDTYIGRATTDTLTNKTFNSAGTGNVFQISGVTTSRGQFPGTTTNDTSTAGNIGEYISSTVLVGSAVALTTATTINVTSISLTAGDWDVSGVVYTNNSGSLSSIEAAINTTSATLPTRPGAGMTSLMNLSAGIASNLGVPITTGRISLASTTTVFLVTNATFTGSCSAYGFIGARRAR